jgi:HEAT repeat protein
MSEAVIEAEGDSLEEARQRLRSKLSEGYAILSENIMVSDTPQSVKDSAYSVQAAQEAAQQKVPTDAIVIEVKELTAPQHETILIEAMNETLARNLASKMLSEGKVVVKANLVAAGRQGFLGIGRKPNQYEVDVLRLAVVEIVYKFRAKLSAKIDLSYKKHIAAIKEGSWSAAEAIVETTDLRAVESLVAITENESLMGTSRLAAIYALGRLGDVHAVEPLIRLIEKGPDHIREGAVKAIGQLDDPRAQKWLNESIALRLTDLDEQVQNRAYKQFQGLDQGQIEQVLSIIRAYAKSHESSVRCEAARALGMLGTQALDELLELLRDSEWNVRGFAAESLGRLKDARAVDPLLLLLRQESTQSTRIKVIEALGSIGDERALEELDRLLGGSDMAVACHSADAIGSIGGDAAIKSLISALRLGPAVGTHAAKALGQLGDQSAIEPLVKFIPGKPEYSQEAAREALRKLGWSE